MNSIITIVIAFALSQNPILHPGERALLQSSNEPTVTIILSDGWYVASTDQDSDTTNKLSAKVENNKLLLLNEIPLTEATYMNPLRGGKLIREGNTIKISGPGDEKNITIIITKMESD